MSNKRGFCAYAGLLGFCVVMLVVGLGIWGIWPLFTATASHVATGIGDFLAFLLQVLKVLVLLVIGGGIVFGIVELRGRLIKQQRIAPTPEGNYDAVMQIGGRGPIAGLLSQVTGVQQGSGFLQPTRGNVQMPTHYAPHSVVREIQDRRTVDALPPTGDRLALPAPRFSVPTVRDLLSRGLISGRMPDLIFGFKIIAQAAEELAEYGQEAAQQFSLKLLRGTWERVKTIILLGESGAGKTSGAAFWLYQAALGGAWFIIIDPEGDSDNERSLVSKLGPLESRFLMEPASSEEEIEQAVELAFQILEKRRRGLLKKNSAVIVVADEFAEMMRRRKPGNAYDRLAQLFEAYSTGGLKHWCFGVAMTQNAKVTRSGGSEFRDTCPSAGVFRTLPKMAKLLLDERGDEVAEELMETVKKLPDGQLLLRLSGTQILHLAIPMMTWEDMTAMGAMVDELRIPHPIYGEVPPAEWGPTEDSMVSVEEDRRPVRETTALVDESPLPPPPVLPAHLTDKAQQVHLKLLEEPTCSRTKLLKLFWDPKGGGRNFDQYMDEVEAVLEFVYYHRRKERQLAEKSESRQPISDLLGE
jgi:hypothetical protein